MASTVGFAIMAITQRMRKAAKNVGKSSTEAEALEKAEYSPSYARSGRIKYTAGWQELVEKNIDKKKVFRVIDEGMDANKPILDGEGFWPDHPTRLKAADTAIKVTGGYAPEKTLNLNVEVEATEEIKEAAKKLNELYRGTSKPDVRDVSGPMGDQAPDKE